ncbi:hypothetical protein AXJ14_gp029 [Geobacillus virus E3]|uniref:hypothetical protein n=1 Tax=Geobacillus virus E3 TaxID=1572712 RepID=UPI000671BBA1|nr:hypothetical protein AXJ14_gp029 [Geobacillus virus E3]AJA41348.1 hypothetical protein E3_029 [Geobacillus virus E3]
MSEKNNVNNEKETMNSFEEFTNFLADIVFRLNKLEEEVAELKKGKIDVDKIKTIINDKLDIMRALK